MLAGLFLSKFGDEGLSAGELMTALDIRVVCGKLEKWLGGDLIGTVNLDFSGDEPLLEMIVESNADS